MPYDLNFTGARQDETNYVAWLMQLFAQARTRRVNFEVQWEEAAALVWPEYRNSFAFGHVRAPGMKYTEYQIDSAGAIAAHRFMALQDTLITPAQAVWSHVQPDNKDLLKQRGVAQYYERVTEVLWSHRYRPEANFVSQNLINWQANGVFGNYGMMIDEYDARPGPSRPGLRYCATSPGEMYILRNHQGRETGFIRHFRWSAQQAATKFGMNKIGTVLRAALDKQNRELFDFLQFCIPNTEYDPKQHFSFNGKPWASVYVAVQGYQILEQGGYRSYPRAGGGYMRAPEEDYDRGPAQMVLPALKSLNTIAALFLRQANKAADPAFLLADDGLVDFKTYPGAYNYGGMSPEGHALAGIVPSGEIQVTQEMIESQLRYVNAGFLVDLYPILQPADKQPNGKTARQVVEDAVDRGMFLAPTLGRAFSDYIPMMCDRELDCLAWMSAGLSEDKRADLNLLPVPPPVLREAKGDYKLEFQSPLANAMRGQGQASFYRMIEQTQGMIQAGADPALLDRYDLDEALPDIARDTFVPVNWMASDQKVASKAKTRAQAAERENQVKELPGKAAIMKAQAISDKAGAGQNIGGTLSGTPSGGMPLMPGQLTNGGSAFGQPGAQQ